MTTHEEAVLRSQGFELVRAADNRYVATERANAIRTASSGLPTAPHATADEAWRAAYRRVNGN
jgi:hypothetical protein